MFPRPQRVEVLFRTRHSALSVDSSTFSDIRCLTRVPLHKPRRTLMREVESEELEISSLRDLRDRFTHLT